MNEGFKTYIVLFLWLAFACWVPSLIFDVEDISLCAVIAVSIGFAIGIAVIEHPDSKGFFAKELPFTCIHFWMFVAYAVVGMFMIGFADMDYSSLRGMGKSVIYFLAMPLVSLIIENSRREKKKKARYKELLIGQIYEEENSREDVPYHTHRKYFEFTRETLWIIKELRGYKEIVLQDVHFPRRIKSVTIDELNKYTPTNGIIWYRSPEYYAAVIEAIKKRAEEEIYFAEEENEL